MNTLKRKVLCVGLNEIPFRLIPAGMALIGSERPDAFEGPLTEVLIAKSYWLAEVPVTQILYELVAEGNPSTFVGDLLPVNNIRWQDANEFCIKMGELTGRRIRLPTEVEWEYACRAGDRSTIFSPLEKELWEYAWMETNSGYKVHPVGLKKPNDFGLYDMLGNVSEWCANWFGKYPGGKRDHLDFPPPPPPHWMRLKVLRGGSYSVPRQNVTPASRFPWPIGSKTWGKMGFRVLMEDEPESAG